MTQTRVLVVDDEPDLCDLVQDTLESDYLVDICTDAQQAIAQANQFEHSIIVLDINLPNINGLDLAKSLLESCNHAPLILFISGDNSLERRLDAYNSGGADFLPKPFKLQELRVKVDALKQHFDQRQQLKQNSDMASQTAMNAMVEASQYGSVLRFYNQMYSADTLEKIHKEFHELMQSFGLLTSVQYRMEFTASFDHNGNDCSPIEEQIFEKLSSGDRIISFSKRMMINGTYVSMIIKNMPIDDEVSSGRWRDILATLIEGMDAKLLDLQRLELLRQTTRELAMSSQRLSGLMKDHEDFITNAMNHIISEINASFHTLELTEQQESFFTELCERILNSMEESFIQVGNESDVLECLRLSLSAVLKDQKTQPALQKRM